MVTYLHLLAVLVHSNELLAIVFSGILITQVTAKEESLRVPGLPEQETLRHGISLLLQVGGLLTPGWTLGRRHGGLIF